MKKYYITTTIPYANAPPHVGFALEIIQADVIARWHRLKGEDVFFLTGTDEHGTKNYQTAKKEGLTPQQFVDRNASKFIELAKILNISNNNFIRTTDKKAHWPGVIKLWKTLADKKDIYKKKYTGSYCSGCERFVTEKDLVNGKCPNHPNREIENISEENYFFKLSKYSDKIIELIKKDKLEIYPEKWKNDFLSLIKDGLTDVSFSRDKKHLPWGINVPGDENQVMYVWCDALTNYLTGIGYPDKRYKKYWPADVHVVGKDMLRFHTGIWPGMLLSAGIPLPKKVIVHGFLTIDKQKISKSLGNTIDPIFLANKYCADSLRYFLARTVPFGDDGDFSEHGLAARHNSELADKLGNLISRVSALAEKYGMKKCPNKLLKKLKQKQIEKCLENYELDKALNLIFEFIDNCNLYVQEKKPWETHDTKVLYELAESIKAIAILLWPFIPESCEKIAKQFGFALKYGELKKPYKVQKISKVEILFTKIEQEIKAKEGKKEEKIEGIIKMSEMVSFNEWGKIDLRAGKIAKAEDIEGADKLYKLEVDLGSEKKTILAGIKQFYKKDELKGKMCIVFSNLEPRLMRGIKSEGMILAAVNADHSKVVLIAPEKDIELGSRIS